MFHKTDFLKDFHKFTGLFLIKLQAFRSATLLKRDSSTDIFLLNFFKIFKKMFFYRTLSGDWFRQPIHV